MSTRVVPYQQRLDASRTRSFHQDAIPKERRNTLRRSKSNYEGGRSEPRQMQSKPKLIASKTQPLFVKTNVEFQDSREKTQKVDWYASRSLRTTVVDQKQSIKPHELRRETSRLKLHPLTRLWRDFWRLDEAKRRRHFSRQHLIVRIWTMSSLACLSVLSVIGASFAIWDIIRAIAEGQQVDSTAVSSNVISRNDLLFVPSIFMLLAAIMVFSAVSGLISIVGVLFERLNFLIVGEIMLPFASTGLFVIFHLIVLHCGSETAVHGILWLQDQSVVEQSLTQYMRFASGTGMADYFAGEVLRQVPWTTENLQACGYLIDEAPVRWKWRMERIDRFVDVRLQSVYLALSVTTLIASYLTLAGVGTMKDDIMLIISRDTERALHSLDTRPTSAIRMERKLQVLESRIVRHIRRESREFRRIKRKQEKEKNEQLQTLGVSEEELTELEVPVTLAWLKAATKALEGRKLQDISISISLRKQMMEKFARDALLKRSMSEETLNEMSGASIGEESPRKRLQRSASFPVAAQIVGLFARENRGAEELPSADVVNNSPLASDDLITSTTPSPAVRGPSRLSLPSNVRTAALKAAQAAQQTVREYTSAKKKHNIESSLPTSIASQHQETSAASYVGGQAGSKVRENANKPNRSKSAAVTIQSPIQQGRIQGSTLLSLPGDARRRQRQRRRLNSTMSQRIISPSVSDVSLTEELE